MVATADWTAAPQGSPVTVRLGCEHVSSAPDPSSWGFSTLEHAACLHGAALVTLFASSRPQRTSGTAVADSASDSVTLDGLRREQPPSDLAGVTLKLPDGTVKVRACAPRLSCFCACASVVFMFCRVAKLCSVATREPPHSTYRCCPRGKM